MYYDNEQEIDNLLRELEIDILEIDDTFTPTEEEENGIYELYDILD